MRFGDKGNNENSFICMCLCFTVGVDVLEMPKNSPLVKVPDYYLWSSECMRAAERKYAANEKEKRSVFVRRWGALPKAVLANTAVDAEDGQIDS